MDRVEIEKKILGNLVGSEDNHRLCIKQNVKKLLFSDDSSKSLFGIMMWHFKKYGTTLESDSLQSVLARAKKLTEDQKKKITILFEDIKSIPRASNFEILLDDLREAHKYDSLSSTFKVTLEDMHDKNTDKVVKQWKKDLIRIERETALESPDAGFYAADSVKILEDYDDRAKHPEKYLGTMLGIKALDAATAGLEGGTVTLIMGEMKSAKSVLMVNFVKNVAKAGGAVYYHINEGSLRMARDRLTSSWTGIPYNHVKRAMMTPDERDLYEKFLKEREQQQNIYMERVSPAMSSAAYIDSKMGELHPIHDFKIIMIDYIGLMNSDNPEAKDWMKQGIISIELKDLAAKYNVPVVALAHVNRKGMKSNKKKDSFEMEDYGMSIEPLKNVDMIASWKIDEPELFKETKTGTGTLAIPGARDSDAPAKITLHVNTHKMLIKEESDVYIQH